MRITNTGGTVSGGTGPVIYQGGQLINLETGFTLQPNTDFTLTIKDFPISGFKQFFLLKDHLGSTRVVFSDVNNNGSVDASEIISQESYYPFGKSLEGNWNSNSKYNYLYTGQERQKRFSLGYDRMTFRFYDPTIARFMGVDLISDQFPHVNTFNYAENSPIVNVDLHGLQRLHFMRKLNLAVAKKIVTANDNADRLVRGLELASGQKATTFQKISARTSTFIDEFGEFTPQNDGAIFISGQNLDGSDANGLDMALAAGGALLPFVSGNMLKKLGKFIPTEAGAQSDEVVQAIAKDLKGATSQKEFDKIILGSDGPIQVVEIDGQQFIIDGHHRVRAAEQANTGFSLPVQQVNVEDTRFKTVKELIEASKEKN
jgi:RHS repeat-associated protein